MLYFVVNSDLLGGLRLDEWWKERTGWGRKIIKEGWRSEINERDIETGTAKQTMCSIFCFLT